MLELELDPRRSRRFMRAAAPTADAGDCETGDILDDMVVLDMSMRDEMDEDGEWREPRVRSRTRGLRGFLPIPDCFKRSYTASICGRTSAGADNRIGEGRAEGMADVAALLLGERGEPSMGVSLREPVLTRGGRRTREAIGRGGTFSCLFAFRNMMPSSRSRRRISSTWRRRRAWGVSFAPASPSTRGRDDGPEIEEPDRLGKGEGKLMGEVPTWRIFSRAARHGSSELGEVGEVGERGGTVVNAPCLSALAAAASASD